MTKQQTQTFVDVLKRLITTSNISDDDAAQLKGVLETTQITKNDFITPNLFKDAIYKCITAPALAIGTHIIYTVPKGKKVLIAAGSHGAVFCAASPLTTTFFWKALINNYYYKISNNFTINSSNGFQSTNIVQSPLILNEGESLSIEIAGQNGVNVWAGIVEFSDNIKGVKSYRLEGIQAGENVIAEIPINKTSISITYAMYIGITTPWGNCFFWNNSGSNITVNHNLVPLGDTIATANKLLNPQVVSPNSSYSFATPSILPPGSKLILTSSNTSPNCFVYFTVVEV